MASRSSEGGQHASVASAAFGRLTALLFRRPLRSSGNSTGDEGSMDICLGITDELEEYRRIVDGLRRALIAYEARISEMIASISVLDYDEASARFNELHSIQGILATAKYKFEFPLGERLDDFVYHMDRDDEKSRRYWYGRIVGGMIWPGD